VFRKPPLIDEASAIICTRPNFRAAPLFPNLDCNLCPTLTAPWEPIHFSELAETGSRQVIHISIRVLGWISRFQPGWNLNQVEISTRLRSRGFNLYYIELYFGTLAFSWVQPGRIVVGSTCTTFNSFLVSWWSPWVQTSWSLLGSTWNIFKSTLVPWCSRGFQRVEISWVQPILHVTQL